MQIYNGNRRIFETLIEEDSNSTSTSRIINIPGITRYSEIKGCIIPVKAVVAGSAATTYIKVAGLSYVELKIFYDSSTPQSPNSVWINPGQVYNLIYTGTYFTLMGANTAATKNYVDTAIQNSITSVLSQSY